MSNSSLVDIKVPAISSNYSIGRSGRKIEMISIHHMAGILTAGQCGNIFQNALRKASAHYGIGNDGKVGLYVDEFNTAWTNGNWDANCKAVTIEVSNCEIGGQWRVSDVALNKLIKLVADISKRNGLGKLIKGKNLTWHRMYANTTCPGNYLISKMDYIVEKANALNGYTEEVVNNTDHKYKLGDEVIFSTCYTSSTATNDYAIPSNKMLRNHGKITKIVNARNPYLLDNGMCWVNDGDIRGYYTKKNDNNSNVDINKVANKVIRGDYGNGGERTNKLKSDGFTPEQIKEIQDRVNKILSK